MHMKHSIKYYLLAAWLMLTSFTHGYAQIRTGAEQTEQYFPLIEGKSVALTVNQTSLIGEKHLLDSLYNIGIDITRIFALQPSKTEKTHARAFRLLHSMGKTRNRPPANWKIRTSYCLTSRMWAHVFSPTSAPYIISCRLAPKTGTN